MRFENLNYERKQKQMKIAAVAVALIVVIGLWLVVTGDSEGPQNDTSSKRKKDEFYQRLKKEKPASPKTMELKDIIKKISPLVVLIQTYNSDDTMIGQGSGFFINKDAHLISNKHVLQGSDHAKVKSKFGTFTVKSYLADSDENDLILFSVKKPRKKIPGIKINTTLPEVGEKIFVIGNPMGLESTVSDGIVSAVRELEPFGKVIQITSPISPGSSGSPVINMKGEFIGVATFQMIQGQNLNFAIPIARAMELKSDEELLLTQIETAGGEEFKSISDPVEKGKYLYEHKSYRNASIYLKEAIQKDYSNAEAHFYLGLCYRGLKSTESVIELLNAIALKPDYHEAHYELGVSYMEMNSMGKSIESLEEALEIKPDYFEAMVKLGGVHTIQRQYKTGRRILENALEYGESAEAYQYLGFCYSELTLHMDAIRSFQRAIDIDDNRLESYVGLIYVLVKVENFSMGLDYIEDALIKAPNNIELRFLKGVLHLGNEDLASAESELHIMSQMKVKKGREFISKLRSAISQYKRYMSRR